jgi:mono/diheme cytochrome c family protein
MTIASRALTGILSLLLLVTWPAAAATLTVAADSETQTYTTAQLLARPDAIALTVPDDVSYKRTMVYRAVPLRPLLAPGKADTLEVRATDGFVAQIPVALVMGKAVPWLAIEDPAHPWPPLPGRKQSAGPFYIVWQNPARGNISPEQWPYAVASLTEVESPALRWPAIAAAASAPAIVQHGQKLFITNCLACHRLNHDGQGDVGPDLLHPMPATAYLTDAGLHALIRNPAAVRTWPEQHMPGFAVDVLSDADIDAIIGYLHHFAGRKPEGR